ncbi:hypothetical protein DFH06DRAFT_1156193 [Mycena polygramma]|nr:hypothetical protein DFH06DRAFT_1156193 [Mycena polygramma]
MTSDDEADLGRNFETAKLVYEDVKSEFYSWKGKHVAEIWNRLDGSDSSFLSGATECFRMPRTAFEAVPLPTPDPELGDADCLYFWDYDLDGNLMGPGEAIPIVIGEAANAFVPHPPYQYCTPASRNHNARMIDNRAAPFVPFSEDPTFPCDAYLQSFQSYQWEDDQQDPDGNFSLTRCGVRAYYFVEEVIQYETVRRLHVDHGYSATMINNVLREYTTFRPLRLSNESGLLWDVSQRDLPLVIWGDGRLSTDKKQLPPRFAQDPADNLFRQINNGLAKFCPNLNCIMHNCHVHIDYDWEHLTDPITPKEPHRTNQDLYTLAKNACGAECFLLIAENDMEVEADDDEPIGASTAFLSILKLEPDMLPCDMAITTGMACRQAFLRRKQTIADKEVVPEAPASKKRRKTRLLEKKKKKEKQIFSGIAAPPAPCVHPGPCSSANICDCFRLKKHCERNCRCADGCARRWQGCNSTCAHNRRCSDKDRRRPCKCRAAERECDPEKCTMCDARNTHAYFPDALPVARTGGGCTNVALQRGTFKRFEVRRSMYGLGAFAVEDMRENDMLGEYVGELLDEHETLDHRHIIHMHSKLNYCFGMEGQEDTTVDAQWLGNPTRFLNHATPPNCYAQELVVNGERRLAIRALQRIKKGVELTLDYGDKYWKGLASESGRDSDEA